MTAATPEPTWEWDTEVEVLVRLRVKAKPNPDYYEGLLDRTPTHLAKNAVLTGHSNPENIDGFADLTGDVDIIDVTEAPW